ncbi:MAG: aminotransferase class V-fold PLP-dependent enzyme [Lysobacteraceae bacterium]
MYAPLDPAEAQAVAARITPDYLHDLLAGYVRAEVVAPAQGRAIEDQLQPLLNLIRSKLSDDEFWPAFQRHFGFAHVAERDRVVPMNAANLCPEPTALINAANQLRTAYNNNVAQQVRTAGGERVEQLKAARRRLAGALGLREPEDLALIRNSSEGNNAISCGYRGWRQHEGRLPIDKVVVWSENHPTNLEAWRLRRDWRGHQDNSPRPGDDQPKPGDPFRLIVVDVPRDGSAEAIAKAFTDHIDENTRFVSYSDISNASGTRIPERAVAMIWEKARPFPDCHVHIDGTMSWGARRVNLGDAHCHSFVSSAHKWFLGPKETGIFYMHRSRIARFTPGIFAYDYRIEIGNWDRMPGNALRFELLGQRDDVNLITLDLTQAMWDALQARHPYARVAALADTLIGRLRTHWTLRTPEPQANQLGIVRVEAPRNERPGTPSLQDWVYAPERAARHGRFGGSGGSEEPSKQTFRLCPHLYNTDADIERVVASMNAWRDLHGA